MNKSFEELEIWAVDFDGTLCTDMYPSIGIPNEPLIALLKEAQKEGIKLILWTCRCGARLSEARQWCAQHGLVWDTVNNNLPETIKHFKTESRKVYATLYLDDLTLGFSWWSLRKLKRKLSAFRRRRHRLNSKRERQERQNLYNTWCASINIELKKQGL